MSREMADELRDLIEQALMAQELKDCKAVHSLLILIRDLIHTSEPWP